MIKRLDILDYARFVAVLLVISFHYTYNGIANGKISSITHIPFIIEYTKYGYLGVELFFLISGYVIFYSAKNRTASQFAIARAVRLYPAYWFAVIFTSIFAYFWGGDLMSVSLPQIIANLSMFQSYFTYANVDGVYWTLVLEVQFYMAVFLLLLIGMQKYFEAIFIAWPILMLLAFLFHFHIPLFSGYFSYFAAGALFAIMKEKKTWPVIVSTIVSYALSISFSISGSKSHSLNEYIVVTIISLFFILFIIQDIKKMQNISLPKAKILSALTYPIYLIHAHFGYMFISRFATESNKIIIYFITILIVFSVAYFMHKIIEVKFASMWKKLFNFFIGNTIIIFQNLIYSLFLKNKMDNSLK